MGRRKIEIQPLSDDRNRTVTFVKRKAGLFKKAHELAVLCQVDIAVLIVGSNDKIYEFSLVDTKEIIKAYQRTSKLQEEKSPESYGRYTKKAKLGSRKIGNIDDDDIIINDDGDLDYDSEGDVKRLKRSYDDMMQTDSAPGPRLNLIPTFTYNKASGTNRNSQGPPITTGAELKDKASDSGRPVLRVQIPSDVKSEIPDSAKTITALDLNLHEKNGGVGDNDKNRKPGSANPAPVINSARYQTMGVFRLPDTRRPITTLPLPIQSKSLTLSPSSATAPPLPNSMGSFYGSMPQNNQYTGNLILPTPILTQIFNQQYVMGNQQRQQTPQMPIQNPSQLMLKVNPGNAGSPDHSQQVNDQNHPARHDETSRTGPQSSSVGSSTTGPVNQNESAAGVAGDVANQYGQGKFRPPFFSTGSSTMNVNTQANLSNGEQTPVSGLPSRYMDMFPLPSNFYASQDWLNSGVTPMHLMMPHYFASAAPQSAVTTTAARPPPGGGLPQQQQQQQQHQNWAHQQQAPPQQQQPQQERLLGDQPSPTSQQQSQQHP